MILKLGGGLGNQLFQYAFIRSLSLRINKDFMLDTSLYKNKRKYHFDCSILNYNIVVKYPPRFINKFLDLTDKYHYMYALNKVFNRFFISKFLPRPISERKFNLQKKMKNEIMLLIGYWLDLKYFSDYADVIRKEFMPKNDLAEENKRFLEKIVSSNSISMHIRRGAYVIDPVIANVYYDSSLDYYRRAVSYMTEKITNPIFFIFSNEIDWAKKNLKIDYPVVYIDNNGPDFEHLYLMSKCKHNIITSSSFSWWGAWLNSNESKIVIAPKKLSKRKDWEKIMPKSWLRFDN